MPELSKLESILNYKFKNIDYLKQALVHRSYLNEHLDFALGHNERLEYLGDAVLELVVTEYLYENFPEKDEGILTNWRASLVNSKMLFQVASNLDIEEFLHLSKGEAKDKSSKSRRFILADSVEAIIGAMYLDKGIAPAKKFILKNIISSLENIINKGLYLDPKSRFQELSQEKEGVTPHYKLIKESGPDHEKTFVVGLYLKDELVSSGKGLSKHEAQVKAAQAGLIKKGWQ